MWVNICCLFLAMVDNAFVYLLFYCKAKIICLKFDKELHMSLTTRSLSSVWFNIDASVRCISFDLVSGNWGNHIAHYITFERTGLTLIHVVTNIYFTSSNNSFLFQKSCAGGLQNLMRDYEYAVDTAALTDCSAKDAYDFTSASQLRQDLYICLDYIID